MDQAPLLTDSHLARIYASRCLITDLHATLIDGRAAGSLFRYFVSLEWPHPHHLLGAGLYGLKKLFLMARGDRWSEEHERLSDLFTLVYSRGCVSVADLRAYARAYIKSHVLPNAIQMMRYMGSVMPTFISTAGLRVEAQEMRACVNGEGQAGAISRPYPGCVGDSGNELLCRNGTAKGVVIGIRDARDKREAAERMIRTYDPSLSLQDSTVLGNDFMDLELMKVCRIALVSPRADREFAKEVVAALDGVAIEDYGCFAARLARRRNGNLSQPGARPVI